MWISDFVFSLGDCAAAGRDSVGLDPDRHLVCALVAHV